MLDYLSITLGVIGVLLAIWSLWYARVQQKRADKLHRSEMISLWASLKLNGIMIKQIQEITGDNGYINPGKSLNDKQRTILPRIFKGLCHEYVRIVEQIVKKTPEISLSDIEMWYKGGRIETKWRRDQFLNLVAATTKGANYPEDNQDFLNKESIVPDLGGNVNAQKKSNDKS